MNIIIYTHIYINLYTAFDCFQFQTTLKYHNENLEFVHAIIFNQKSFGNISNVVLPTKHTRIYPNRKDLKIISQCVNRNIHIFIYIYIRV